MNAPIPNPAAPVHDAPRPSPLPVFVLALLLSTCSLLYELLAAQTVSLLAANTVIWYSVVLGTFLAAMGVGSWRSGRVRDEALWPRLLRIELLLTLIGAAIAPAIHLAHALYLRDTLTDSAALGLFVFYGTVGGLVIAVGVLTGAELPLLMRIARAASGDSRAMSIVLGLDYFGALVAGLLFPLVLAPSLSLTAIGLLIAAVNLTAAAWIRIARVRAGAGGAARTGRVATGAAIPALAAAMVVAAANLDDIHQYLLKRYYYYRQLGVTVAERFEARDDLPEVLRRRSPYQRIDLAKDVEPDFSAHIMPAFSRKLARDPEYPVDNILFLNGDFQTNTRFDEIYHEWFAHVPIIVRGAAPRRVLLLGGGDGLLLSELVKYDDIERITHIDLDRELVSLATTHPVLRHANHDAFLDPRVSTRYSDGYQYVRRTSRRFDAVYIDFPVARNYDLAKLYSREFFHFVRGIIEPGGFAVFDATGTSHLTSWRTGPRMTVEENDWPVYYHTLKKAGFPVIQPYLTTLERDNEEARARLRHADFGGAIDAAVAAITDPEEREEKREEILEDAVDQLMEAHVVSLEQGFILLVPDDRELDLEYKDLGVEYDVLNERRFELAFAVEFPRSDHVDESMVNSILRPTFPTLPWWLPRQPF